MNIRTIPSLISLSIVMYTNGSTHELVYAGTEKGQQKAKISKHTEPSQDIVWCPDLPTPHKPVSSRSVERKYDEHNPPRKPTHVYYFVLLHFLLSLSNNFHIHLCTCLPSLCQFSSKLLSTDLKNTLTSYLLILSLVSPSSENGCGWHRHYSGA